MLLRRRLPLLTSEQEDLLDCINTGLFAERVQRTHPSDRRQLSARAERLCKLGLIRYVSSEDFDTTSRGRLYLRLRYQNGPGPQSEFISRMGRRLRSA